MIILTHTILVLITFAVDYFLLAYCTLNVVIGMHLLGPPCVTKAQPCTQGTLIITFVKMADFSEIGAALVLVFRALSPAEFHMPF